MEGAFPAARAGIFSTRKTAFARPNPSYYDKAVMQFRMALRERNTSEVHCDLAMALLKQSKTDEGLREFGEAVKKNKRYAAAYVDWGQALLAQNRPEEAARVYRDGLAAIPNSASLHFNTALALEAQAVSAESSQRDAETDGRESDAASSPWPSRAVSSDALPPIRRSAEVGPGLSRTSGGITASCLASRRN